MTLTQFRSAQEAVASALFHSPLWVTWCGEELHIANDLGQNARHEAARIAVEALRALPIEERMEAMGMQRFDLMAWLTNGLGEHYMEVPDA